MAGFATRLSLVSIRGCRDQLSQCVLTMKIVSSSSEAILPDPNPCSSVRSIRALHADGRVSPHLGHSWVTATDLTAVYGIRERNGSSQFSAVTFRWGCLHSCCTSHCGKGQLQTTFAPFQQADTTHMVVPSIAPCDTKDSHSTLSCVNQGHREGGKMSHRESLVGRVSPGPLV